MKSKLFISEICLDDRLYARVSILYLSTKMIDLFVSLLFNFIRQAYIDYRMDIARSHDSTEAPAGNGKSEKILAHAAHRRMHHSDEQYSVKIKSFTT